MAGYEWITFTSDYGLEDPFVGVCHGVVARVAPRVRVIDVTHAVGAQDVRHGAWVLAQAVPYLPRAVHLAVVDPGVGTGRGMVAVEAGGQALVGPDNGLLVWAAEALGGVERVHELENPAYRLVTLTNLDDSGNLSGDYADVCGNKSCAFSPDGTFLFGRDHTWFEQVVAYHAITQAQLYIQSLGFTNVNNEPQVVRVAWRIRGGNPEGGSRVYLTGRHQSIGSWPAVRSAALTAENGRLPKNPVLADSGEGCGDFRTA